MSKTAIVNQEYIEQSSPPFLRRVEKTSTRIAAVEGVSLASLGVLREAVTQGHQLSNKAHAGLLHALENELDDVRTVLVLECLNLDLVAVDQRKLIFNAAERVANSENPFLRFRACLQLRRLGRRHLLFDNASALACMRVADHATPALRARIQTLLAA